MTSVQLAVLYTLPPGLKRAYADQMAYRVEFGVGGHFPAHPATPPARGGCVVWLVG